MRKSEIVASPQFKLNPLLIRNAQSTINSPEKIKIVNPHAHYQLYKSTHQSKHTYNIPDISTDNKLSYRKQTSVIIDNTASISKATYQRKKTVNFPRDLKSFSFEEDPEINQKNQFSSSKNKRNKYISSSFIEYPQDEGETIISGVHRFLISSPKRKKIHRHWRLQLDPLTYQRFDLWSKKLAIKYQTPNTVQTALLDGYIHILASIQLKQQDELIDICIEIMSIASDVNIKVYSAMVYLISLINFEQKDMNTSVYFIKQGLIISEYLSLHSQHIAFLMLLSRVAIHFKEYCMSELFLLRALLYCWLVNDIENELQVYDQIGLTLYYCSMPIQAQFFHQRFANGLIEPKISLIRRNMVSQIQLYERFQQEQFNRSQSVNAVLLNRLNLPSPKYLCPYFNNADVRIPKYKSADGQELLRSLESQHIQLKCLTIDTILSAHPDENPKKNPNHFIYCGTSPPSAIPQLVLDIKKRHQKRDNKFRIRDNNSPQGGNLQSRSVQIQQHLKMNGDIGQMMDRIRSEVKHNSKTKDQFQYQIYLNHFQMQNQTLPKQIITKAKQTIEWILEL